MSEDLVALARAERACGYADLERAADRALTIYSTWRESDGLDDREIRARLAHFPAVGVAAVEMFQQLTTVGASPDAAAEVAAQAAAAQSVRAQAGAPEQAEAVHAAVATLAGQVAAGQDTAAALADFREAIVGWRGDGYAEGPLGKPVMVAFADGTVLPDGVEIAGVRETGARHSIVAPQVQAGIDAYVAARAEGVEHLAALELAGDGPGVPGAVAQFADDIENYDVDLDTARDAAVASVVADAAIGQFLSLRNAGMDTDQAAGTAAGGDPVAVHAIGGFLARVRDGFAEEVAEPDAWAAAVAAVRFGEDYRGIAHPDAQRPGFEEARTAAAAELDAHLTVQAEPAADAASVAPAWAVEGDVMRRFGWLVRHGMDRDTAARLAAVDTAEEHARVRARNDWNVLDAAETVLRDTAQKLDLTHDAGDAAEQFEDGLGPDLPDPAGEEAEEEAFDEDLGAADNAVRLFERYRRDGRDPAEARAEVRAAFGWATPTLSDVALDRFEHYLAAGYGSDAARDMAAQEAAERFNPDYSTEWVAQEIADPGISPEQLGLAGGLDPQVQRQIRLTAGAAYDVAHAEFDPADHVGELPTDAFRRVVREQCDAHGMSEQDFYAAYPGLAQIFYPRGVPAGTVEEISSTRPEATEVSDTERRDGKTPPLAQRVAECSAAVDAAQAAVAHTDDAHENEDIERAERCARWNSEDQAAEQADDTSEGWEQQ